MTKHISPFQNHFKECLPWSGLQTQWICVSVASSSATRFRLNGGAADAGGAAVVATKTQISCAIVICEINKLAIKY